MFILCSLFLSIATGVVGISAMDEKEAVEGRRGRSILRTEIFLLVQLTKTFVSVP